MTLRTFRKEKSIIFLKSPHVRKKCKNLVENLNLPLCLGTLVRAVAAQVGHWAHSAVRLHPAARPTASVATVLKVFSECTLRCISFDPPWWDKHIGASFTFLSSPSHELLIIHSVMIQDSLFTRPREQARRRRLWNDPLPAHYWTDARSLRGRVVYRVSLLVNTGKPSMRQFLWWIWQYLGWIS